MDLGLDMKHSGVTQMRLDFEQLLSFVPGIDVMGLLIRDWKS